jgi:hypothetical protein
MARNGVMGVFISYWAQRAFFSFHLYCYGEIFLIARFDASSMSHESGFACLS